MKKTAIILGASGLTGSILLQKLIEDDRYESIKLFSRSKIEGLPTKVTQFIENLLKLEQKRAYMRFFKKKIKAELFIRNGQSYYFRRHFYWKGKKIEEMR